MSNPGASPPDPVASPPDPAVVLLGLHRMQKELLDGLTKLQDLIRQGTALRAERRELIAEWVRTKAEEKDLQLFYEYIVGKERGAQE